MANLLKSAVLEYVDMFRTAAETDGAEHARTWLLGRFEERDPETTGLLLVAAIEMLSGPAERLSEPRLRDQLYVRSLRAMLEVGEHRIGTNAAIDAMVTELAKKSADELARVLTLAVHMIIHP